MSYPTPGPRPGPTPGPRPGPTPGAVPGPTPGVVPGPPPGYNALPERSDGETGHPAVDGMLAALENAAQLPPAEQIAEYEAAHDVLRETLASIDG
ncbi:hypothetical protein Acsp02_93940 [Actinoplanes sp. NBRC 103695]|nr:hypothetical protein Acsp02_93940 [Actinoplanes sp. NBRC 103695]